MADTLPGVIDFDLDAVERDYESKPFVVNIGGKPVTFTDPSDLDWQDLLEVESPAGLFRFCLSEEDKEHILGVDIPGWKIGKLMEAVLKHYQLEEKLAKARKQRNLGLQG